MNSGIMNSFQIKVEPDDINIKNEPVDDYERFGPPPPKKFDSLNFLF